MSNCNTPLKKGNILCMTVEQKSIIITMDENNNCFDELGNYLGKGEKSFGKLTITRQIT